MRICTLCDKDFEDTKTRHETCPDCRKKAAKSFKKAVMESDL